MVPPGVDLSMDIRIIIGFGLVIAAESLLLNSEGE